MFVRQFHLGQALTHRQWFWSTICLMGSIPDSPDRSVGQPLRASRSLALLPFCSWRRPEPASFPYCETTYFTLKKTLTKQLKIATIKYPLELIPLHQRLDELMTMTAESLRRTLILDRNRSRKVYKDLIPRLVCMT